MTKKKLFTTAAVATALTAMSVGTAFAADWNTNGGTAEVEGWSYTVSPTIYVELPGDLTFGLNPLYLDADGDTSTTGDNTQIVSTDFLVKNFSNVPVAVTAKTKATAGSGVTMVDTPAASNYDTTSKELVSAENEKAIVLAQMVPTAAITLTNGEPGAMTTTAFAAASVKADVKTGKILGAGDGKETTFTFLLKSATADGALQAGGVSGFKFAGALDPSKTYAEGDVTVQTTFTLRALTSSEADASTGIYKADTTMAGSGGTFDTTVVELK